MIQTGLQVLIAERLDLLRGKRVGLITHPAAVLPDMTSTLDALLNVGVALGALFGPEHGFDGSAADGTAIGDSTDMPTGLRVYSLYGPNKEPTPAMLANVDVLVFDMQDVGARFYTFISTLYYVIRAAGKNGKSLVVLDRPNPINGIAIEGPLVAPGLESFIGILPIPIRHGMTCGELARYVATECHLTVDLTVVPMQGWTREMWFDETGLPWVPLSPGMPHLTTATVYPGTCLIEGTNLSEGRGTTLPFEVVGAPWLDGARLAQTLNHIALPGVRFRPAQFVPATSKHADQTCRGVQVHVTDRQTFRPVETGLYVVAACRAQAPEQFEFLMTSWEGQAPHLDLLAGTRRVREAIQKGESPTVLVKEWESDLACFQETRSNYLLYG